MSPQGRQLVLPPKAVLFDVDGTLIDTVSMIILTMSEMYRRYIGVEIPPEDIRSIIGLPLDVQVRYFEDRTDRRPDYEEMKRFQIALYEQHKHLEHPVPEALEAVRVCASKGIRTALVTSKDAEELAFALPRMGLDGALHATVTATDCVNTKPHPEPVLRALNGLGVAPGKAVFIGDTDYDIQSGHAAGCAVGAVLWGAQTEQRLRQAEPEMLFREPSELLVWCRDL